MLEAFLQAAGTTPTPKYLTPQKFPHLYLRADTAMLSTQHLREAQNHTAPPMQLLGLRNEPQEILERQIYIKILAKSEKRKDSLAQLTRTHRRQTDLEFDTNEKCMSKYHHSMLLLGVPFFTSTMQHDCFVIYITVEVSLYYQSVSYFSTCGYMTGFIPKRKLWLANDLMRVTKLDICQA